MRGNSQTRQAPEAYVAVPEGLVYVSDKDAGIRRRRAGKGFSYHAPDGAKLSKAERARVQGLGIPPAYNNVWICPLPNGHLQATGLDARGRKQYRYHPLWGSWRSGTKYTDLLAFGEALPALRRKIDRDLRSNVGDLDFSLAALVLLLDRAYLRIGNPAYTAQNRTYGATTLLTRHLQVVDGKVRLTFRAKGGKRVQHTVRDKKLNRILHAIGDLPGRNLFTYIDDEGQARSIASQDVNTYLAGATEIAGITAKTFRTWGGTLAAFEVACTSDQHLTIKMMAEAAAERLTNTASICRSSYIHPAVLDLATIPGDARLERLNGLSEVAVSGLRETELRLLSFLKSADETRR